MAREIIVRRNAAQVLAAHGITETAFAGMLEDGELAGYLCRMAKYSAMSRCVEVWTKLKELADEGDVRAIKLYLELCEKKEGIGRGNGAASDPEVTEAQKTVFGDE